MTARAFGAKGVYVEGRDENLVESARKVVETWGGKYFFVDFVDNPVSFIKRWKSDGGLVVHLTMYGLPLEEVIEQISSTESRVLVVVGSERVEGVYYGLADYNVAVGNQPHSEVAALALFLDRFYKGRELYLNFGDSKLKIVPQARGKRVVRNG
ncbi:MAG: tRNA (cytidine(56)-2'-O)-methyltransferase [Sulfolobaceae archaeon]